VAADRLAARASPANAAANRRMTIAIRMLRTSVMEAPGRYHPRRGAVNATEPVQDSAHRIAFS
jgi:hypothetical protein